MTSNRLLSRSKSIRTVPFSPVVSNLTLAMRMTASFVFRDVRRLAIRAREASIFREIASWAARSAFPNWLEGRHPHCHFRGLLRLYSRYGPPDPSATQGGLCHEAPAWPVTRAKPLVSYQINRQLSGWNLPPQVIRAFGAHGQ